PPVKLNDVAELAIERTAARKLHTHIDVMLALEEIEARRRCLGDVDLEFFLRLEHAVMSAACPRGDERRNDPLGFAEYEEVGRAAAPDTAGRALRKAPAGSRMNWD